jgi:hypothetical protein
MDDISSVRSSEINKDMKDKRCAPGINFDSVSCIKLKLLIKLAGAYNEDASNSDKIKMSSKIETLNPQKYKRYLVREIHRRVGDKCSTQKCWTEQSFIKNMDKYGRIELEKFTFRPDGPEGKFEWLNTYNINDVMKQYEQKYKEFKYMGTVPMDFDDISRLGIKSMDYKKLVSEGKTKLGVVFNLDESWKNGSHWVAMYADIKKGDVMYFDSYGVPPEPRVRRLMRRITKAIESINPKVNVSADYNKVRHQFKNSECGVYSINFIVRMLRGDEFKDICNEKTSDDKINKCRKAYFSNT